MDPLGRSLEIYLTRPLILAALEPTSNPLLIV